MTFSILSFLALQIQNVPIEFGKDYSYNACRNTTDHPEDILRCPLTLSIFCDVPSPWGYFVMSPHPEDILRCPLTLRIFCDEIGWKLQWKGWNTNKSTQRHVIMQVANKNDWALRKKPSVILHVIVIILDQCSFEEMLSQSIMCLFMIHGV